MTYQARVVDKAREVPGILWQAFPKGAEGRFWYEALENSGLEDQFTFAYAVIEDGDRPVALAPLFVADVPIELVAPEELMPLLRFGARFIPSLLHERTVFVGSPCSDEGAVVLLPGADLDAVIRALCALLADLGKARKAPMLVFKDMPERFAQSMAPAAQACGFFSAVSYPGTEVKLVSKDREDYFRRLKPSHRQQLRRKLRRSEEKVTLDTAIITAPDAAELAEIFALFQQTYEQATTKFERLGPAFFEEIAKTPPARFLTLRDRKDGRLAAFMLLFDLGEVVINKFIGIDYHRDRDEMLYFRLTVAAIDFARENGARVLQSGQTGYRVKMELGHSLVGLVNFGRRRDYPMQLIYSLVARTLSWASLDADLAQHLKAHPENPTAESGRWG